MVKAITIISLLFFISVNFIWAQPNKVNPNGYNTFYYENGKISSEGTMHNGKPDSFWKTYYPSGIVKSEGNRLNFELDSLWIFYNEHGDTLQKIDYKKGKKNGYLFTYEYLYDNNKTNGGLASKELYLNDVKQGISFYYEKGVLYKAITYKDGKKHGLAKEFDKTGKIISITEYSNDYIINREKINQVDNKGFKQGVWKTFHPNNKLAVESNFLNDTLSGYYKEFDISGKLLKIVKYMHGNLLSDSLSEEKNPIKWVEDYYDNGKIKFLGGYKEGVPVGIHKEYPRDGSVIIAKEYDEMGILSGEGALDENDKKQGNWKYYYETGELKALGAYKDNLKTGDWIYYYLDGKVEQKGKYSKDKPSGLWVWYYDNGKTWREENMDRGKEEGAFVEYDKEGNILLKGEYTDGEREGVWYYHAGDITDEGSYQAGLQNGPWKQTFSNGKTAFEGNYVQGVLDGKQKWYYDNGYVREEGLYSMGSREKNWYKYDMQGVLYLTITYKNDKEYKLNGVKIKLPRGIKE